MNVCTTQLKPTKLICLFFLGRNFSMDFYLEPIQIKFCCCSGHSSSLILTYDDDDDDDDENDANTPCISSLIVSLSSTFVSYNSFAQSFSIVSCPSCHRLGSCCRFWSLSFNVTHLLHDVVVFTIVL